MHRLGINEEGKSRGNQQIQVHLKNGHYITMVCVCVCLGHAQFQHSSNSYITQT